MLSNLGKIFRKGLGKRYRSHRVIDDNIKATGLRNQNVIRNPT